MALSGRDAGSGGAGLVRCQAQGLACPLPRRLQRPQVPALRRPELGGTFAPMSARRADAGGASYSPRVLAGCLPGAKDRPRHVGEGSHARPWPHGAGRPAEEADGGTHSSACKPAAGRGLGQNRFPQEAEDGSVRPAGPEGRDPSSVRAHFTDKANWASGR